MARDWKGGNASIFKTIGASNHADGKRQVDDYYATDPKAVEFLCELEKFSKDIWEPACGEGHISKVLQSKGYHVMSSDYVDRGFGDIINFLSVDNFVFDGDIITNPPYTYAKEFVEKALQVIPQGRKIAMFLKLTFLEGKSRKKLFEENPPIRVWVSSSRLICAMNGDFEHTLGSAVAYAWFVWQKGYKGDTVIKWFN